MHGIIKLFASLLLIFPTQSFSMELAEQFNGAMRIDGDSMWISAEGEITNDTPAAFEKFLSTATIWKRQRIVMSSPGGSVPAGMKLGAMIRERGCLATVGRTIKVGEFSHVVAGECASSCVFFLAGGVERTLAAGSRVGVHQISIDYKSLYKMVPVTTDDLNRSFALSQESIGRSVSHFLGMGIAPNIVSMMTTTGPQDIKWLSNEELASTKIVYNPKAFGKWAIESYKAGLVAFTKTLDGSQQLTLFCSGRKMRFLLKASTGVYAQEFGSTLDSASTIQVAGIRISRQNYKWINEKDGALISGDWIGDPVNPEIRATFSLFGEVTGSEADLFSMYLFNSEGFQPNLNLAKKNCIS